VFYLLSQVIKHSKKSIYIYEVGDWSNFSAIINKDICSNAAMFVTRELDLGCFSPCFNEIREGVDAWCRVKVFRQYLSVSLLLNKFNEIRNGNSHFFKFFLVDSAGKRDRLEVYRSNYIDISNAKLYYIADLIIVYAPYQGRHQDNTCYVSFSEIL